MKIITMFSKKEYLVEDDEAENVAKSYNSNQLLRLRSGELINPRGIESIGSPDAIPCWNGYPLNPDGKSFMRDGERIYLEPHNFKEVRYKLHPKYDADIEFLPSPEKPREKLPSSQFAKELGQKMAIGHELRTAAQEESARDLRKIMRGGN